MRNVHIRLSVALIAATGLLLGFQTQAQTTYFEQNFDGPGPFASTTPNNSQFNSLTANNNASFTTSGGALSMTRGTTPAQVAFVRSTNFSPVPSTLYMEVDVSVPAVTAPINGAAIFNIGKSLTGVAAPPNADVFARFSINLGVNNTFQIRNVPGAATGTTVNSNTFPNTQTVKVIVAMNNGSTSVPYFDPRNSTAPRIILQPGSYDIWVNNDLLVKDRGKVAGPSGSTTLTNFNFLFNTGEGTIVFDNLRFREIAGTLPVTLTSFKAQPVGSKVELAWETAWERNSREFVVQRSSDLKEFGDIGRVAAAGETDSRRQYAFTDFNPLPGANYYRLRMVDRDNTYEYSDVDDAVVRLGKPSLVVSGNPTTGERIRLQAPGADLSELQLTSVMGQRIPFRVNRGTGEFVELIPASTLTPGMYFLTLYQEGRRLNAKVLVQ